MNKFKITLIATAFNLSLLSAKAYASSDLDIAIENMSSIHDRVNGDKDIDAGRVVIGFNKIHLTQNIPEDCLSLDAYQVTQLEDVLTENNDIINSGLNDGYEHYDTTPPTSEEIDEANEKLRKSLEGKSLERCHVSYFGAYSDGNEDTYIKVNGEVKFSFGYGLPD